jgi:hypothetical protein
MRPCVHDGHRRPAIPFLNVAIDNHVGARGELGTAGVLLQNFSER